MRSTKRVGLVFSVCQAPLRRQLASERTSLTAFAPAPPIVIRVIAAR